MPTIDAPGGICGATTRVSASSARAFAVERPVPVLVLGLERRPDHARGRVVDEHVERAEERDLLEHAGGGDVAADEQRLGAERAQLLGGRLGRGVRAEVADRHPGRAERRRRRSAIALPIPRDPPVTENRRARTAYCSTGLERGREKREGGISTRAPRAARAGAELGIPSQPSRLRGSAPPSSAFVDACPRSSSSSIFSSP